MNLPPVVLELLTRLKKAGYSAYAVGGCVRDSLLGLSPHDWDLCTSARTDQMLEVFAGENIVPTGLRHGTLTVVRDHRPYEVTTYRVDGSYTDHRHPDAVTFVDRVEEDLSRRDFTVNAMAYSPDSGLKDLFGGQEDLERKIIRCVGEPGQRFEEDALRILRALRFASVFDFEIDPRTDEALRRLSPTLRQVSPERVREELTKLLCGPGAGRILRAYPHELAVVVPAIAPMIGYDQCNHHHLYDLWEHTVRAVEGVPADPVLRMTMLLHDTGKPEVRTTDPAGEGHYIGHQAASARIAESTLDALRFDRERARRIVFLVERHDMILHAQDGSPLLDRKFLLRQLNRLGEENLRALFLIHCADRTATGYTTAEREQCRLRERMKALDQVLSELPCFTLKDLAVKGDDLLALGLRGKAVGEALRMLLEAVMDGRVPNDREALLSFFSKVFLKQ